ncbi:PLP-dependent transferase [Auriculariales sp. MPI-PUGE-AT-0066]|nr:PLP-dependent transferase [Auriculariales sp. MPI-PUGE-AT-0066]
MPLDVATVRAHIPPARAFLTVDAAKNAFIGYFVFTHLVRTTVFVSSHGITGSLRALYAAAANPVIRLMLWLPSSQKKMSEGLEKAQTGIEGRLVRYGAEGVRHLQLPKHGQSREWISAEMSRMDVQGGHTNWKDGQISGAVYHGGDDMSRIIVDAFERYVVSNPLHPDIFPSIRQMEAEVVAMCLRLYNHPTGAGCMTSGGTESILMAVKTHREWARNVKGVMEPEIILPASAHAAFDKAAAYFKIKVHHIPVDPVTRKVPIKAVKRAINWNTIMIVGSAVNFPDGCMDDIVELGKLAKRYNVGLHVDCCLGSFIMPFLEPAGFPTELFDFRVEGVTSISCDTHKYGFAPKGTSVVMYRTAELRKYQYYVNTFWSGGVYASPAISGSRPGSLIAGTWAAMQYMGYEGYLQSCHRTDFPELYILGSPPASVVAFGSRTLNPLAIGDTMSKKGWHLNALTNPAGLHIACTKLTVNKVPKLLADLRASIEEVKASGKDQQPGTMVTLYGLGSTIAGPTVVKEIATIFLNTLYKA